MSSKIPKPPRRPRSGAQFFAGFGQFVSSRRHGAALIQTFLKCVMIISKPQSSSIFLQAVPPFISPAQNQGTNPAGCAHGATYRR
ncbi:MAG: hypothetical protein ORN98_06220 [Alphaproteobacteria bacterium]|nr:hypothetical protein [Alphaproteobacteria bacterium]